MRLWGAESQGEDALTCTHPKTSASKILFINKSSLSPVSSGPKNYVKIIGLFKSKIFHRRVPLWSIFYDNLFFKKVINLPAKLFFKIFFVSGSQNVLLVFTLKIWGTSLKTLGRLEKTTFALSAFRKKKKSNSVCFYTSKISLYNLTSLSLWLPHASSLSQSPKGCGHCSCGKVEVSSALSGPDQPYLNQNSQGQAVF